MSNLTSPAQILIVKAPTINQLDYLSAYLKQAYQLNNFPNPQTYLINQTQESLKIVQVREAISQASFASYNQAKRFFCFLSADLATNAAQNALLKLLEEPPDNSYCLLIVQNPQRLLATVQSRCLTIDLLTYLKNKLGDDYQQQILSQETLAKPESDETAQFDFLLNFISQPDNVSFSQLIDFVSKYKNRQQALTFLQTSLQKLLTSQRLELKNKTIALKKLTQANQDLTANFNVVLALENALFSIKNLA